LKMEGKRILVFGASGTLGSACVEELIQSKAIVISQNKDLLGLELHNNIDGAIWAQGANYSGSLQETTKEVWEEVWEANFNFIIRSLEVLLKNDCLARGARLVILSSIWQERGRANKVAYATSKAAIGGLVRSLAAELGDANISINALLPGIVRSPMTQLHLSEVQLVRLGNSTPGGLLVTPQDVARVAQFLVGPKANGINGQSIVVDNGWSNTHEI
jgi:3-oxoacyl-[acyl-carrier protein] reductase